VSVLEMTIADGVALLRLNRPEVRNAINPEMMVRLADAWTSIEHDGDVKVSVLTGAGPVFSSGGDLKTLIPLLTRARPPADEWDERLLAEQRTLVNTALLRTSDIRKPVISAINGLCYAGGLELMLGTDMRIAASDARFALPEVQRGLIPAGGSVVRLPRQIPRSIAMEMLLGGTSISAERAHQVGLVNALTVASSVVPEAIEFGRRLAANGPLAVRQIQEVIAATAGIPLDEAFRTEDQAARVVMRSEDAREGAQAFAERRTPRFTGR
jgi:enoyl-CoA hydratase